MEIQPEAQDMCNDYEMLQNCIIDKVFFCPQQWKRFSPPAGVDIVWDIVPFQIESRDKVPDKANGIYSFVITPNVADHPLNSLLIYIGKADKMSLRKRFMSYFNEIKQMKRMPLCYLLKKYLGHLSFCFCKIDDSSKIDPLEQELINALIPPGNKEYKGKIGKARGAF
ncbi:MAG: GIY-YIG nuclease family protein [Candidatus Riflebacteria bacterium]|nr:GIY-YIG nuclease family protein [Candidatus Riflebacteria bacterium]